MIEYYDHDGHGIRPLFGLNLNNAQHGGFYARYSLNSQQGLHTIEVQDKDHNDVGHLHWSHLGPIQDINVKSEHRRKGIASAMYRMGHQLATDYPDRVNSGPTHSMDRTPDGDAWAKAVGGFLPPKIDPSTFPNMNEVESPLAKRIRLMHENKSKPEAE
jgi:hypothetical protein